MFFRTLLAVRNHGREVRAREQTLAALAARRESEEKFVRTVDLAARVFEASPDGIVITDRRHHILSANHAFLAVFHYTMSEVQGQRPGLLLSRAPGRARLRQALSAFASHGSWVALNRK